MPVHKEERIHFVLLKMGWFDTLIALFISPTTSLNSTPNVCMFNKSALVEEQRTRKREKSWKTTLVRKEKILHD